MPAPIQFRITAGVLGCVLGGVVITQATPLAPGTASPLFPEFEPLGATLVATTNVTFAGINFFGNVNFTGTLQSSVWAGDASNPFGGLTFTYLLHNDAASLDALGRLTLSRYAGFLTDVSFNGPGVVPFNAVRSVTGDQIDFNLLSGPPAFQHNLLPGQSTALLIIQTDSPVYNLGNASVIDSAVANMIAFVPRAVPEPTVTALALAGIGVAWVRRRR